MTILEALVDRNLFGGLPAFRDLSTWRAWAVFLAAVYGLPFSMLEPFGLTEDAAFEVYRRHTGRTAYTPPTGGYGEAVLIVGRQAGKDRVAALIQDYEAITATPEADGTDMFAVTVCQDARAAMRTQLAYARAPFRQLALLQPLVKTKRSDSLELTTGVTLASYPCRPQAVRGLRARVVICSELAYFRSSEGYPTDVEMLRAVRPTLATTGGKLIVLSSPYADVGALYDLHTKHFGRSDSPTLVWQATAPDMNPTLPADYLQRLEQDDPDAYRSEVLGEFRSGVATLLDPATLAACVDVGVRERAPRPACQYVAHTDAASGTGQDAWTLAIGHHEGERTVLDVCRAWRPPFNPSAVMAEIAHILRSYRITSVTGDRYAPGFVSEGFRKVGVTYLYADRDRTAIYLDVLSAVNARAVLLLDVPDLLRELRGLERRRGASGRDRVDHRPGAHDDLAVSASGVLTRRTVRSTFGLMHLAGL
jgi:hypothetical protein